MLCISIFRYQINAFQHFIADVCPNCVGKSLKNCSKTRSTNEKKLLNFLSNNNPEWIVHFNL